MRGRRRHSADHSRKEVTMCRVSPCDSCQRSDKESCTGCLAWRRWYCQRQALINEYAEIIHPVWRYELPLHPVRKEKTNEDIPADQQR